MPRRRCLPVAPTARRAEVLIVTYCTGAGTSDEPAHTHTAFYTLEGEPIANVCSYWPSHDAEDPFS